MTNLVRKHCEKLGIQQEFEVMDENAAAFQWLKLQKKANTFKSSIHRGVVTEKED